MFINRINIVNYKNLQDVNICLSPKINCLIGLNGEGKTNFLDAVYYLSFCRSAYTTLDSHVIRHDEDFFMLEGDYLNERGEPVNVFCGMKRGAKKHFKRDNKEYKRLSQHIGLIPLILVSPSDTILIEGGSEERRRLLDVVISQYDNMYIDALTNYNKALLQRNAMLKAEEMPDDQLISILEEQMAEYGEMVFSKREAFITQLIPLFQKYYTSISREKEHVSLRYISHCQRGPLLDIIRRDRLKDRAVGYSLHGIHRDDLEMLIDDYPVRREGSQGQNKTFAIALKLAQFDFLKLTCSKTPPILLLDDIFDKLDATRVEQIVHIVASDDFGQIFLTDTNRDNLDRILQDSVSDYKIFSVEGGNIIEKEAMV
ncbi:MAG: DNA replication and repair protein RecF [Prevotella sp.]|nr:DNA replication and repair protein RecF [Prevotella sp.]